jgi:SAM-dependent methyltransferase
MVRGASAEDVVRRAGLSPEIATVPVTWVLGMLAAGRLAPPLPRRDPREVEAAQEAHDPRCLPSFRIAALAASRFPDVVRGEVTGEQALFGADHMEAWSEYFSNANPTYGVTNRIAALAARRALDAEPGAVLEIGGGLGSGAEALLEGVEAAGRLGAIDRYHFTEISVPFLRRAQRALPARVPDAPLRFGRLDIDRPFAEQGIEPESCALVHAVNVVHVARDLPFTLGEIRSALRPGGTLVLGECVRPFPGRPVYVELVFNLLEAFRLPGAGFRTPEAWAAALGETGFADIRMSPDVRIVREAYPSFVVASIAATRP